MQTVHLFEIQIAMKQSGRKYYFKENKEVELMKRKITKKVFALILSVLLSTFTLMDNVYATSFCEKNRDEIEMETENMEITLPEKSWNIKKAKKKIKSVISVDNQLGKERLSSTQFQARLSGIISYGSLSGYLSQTNECVLYPTNLSEGDYFQAKLQLPNNAQIDYDLLLLNSSLSIIKLSDYVTYLNEGGDTGRIYWLSGGK